MAPMTRNDLINKFELITGMGAEVGVYSGEFAKEILLRYKGNLLCVDRWSGDTVGLGPQDWSSVFDAFISNCDGFRHRTITMIGLSVDMAREVEDNSLDFVYIDADHQYEAVKSDIEAWFPKVRVGGIISGHDYLRDGYEPDPQQGVNRAVDEFFLAKNIEVNLTNEDKWRSWWVVKNAV